MLSMNGVKHRSERDTDLVDGHDLASRLLDLLQLTAASVSKEE